ncbi:hypothetical protein Tco_0327440 [Tanacetum coccineum]
MCMSASPEAFWLSGILASAPGCLALLCYSRCANNSASLPSQPAASGNESHIPGDVSEREYSAAVAMPGVHGYGSCVHTHDHGGSEAPDGLPDSILLSEPKPLKKHRPPPP